MKNCKGFTLIEVSIVLLIVALALGGLLVPLSSRMEQSRITETQNTIAEIKDALVAFSIINGRLPCPDTNNNGNENQTGANCSSATGRPPIVQLGLTDNQDAWGMPLIYRVTLNFADLPPNAGVCGAVNPTVSFEICDTGDINISELAGGVTPVANNVPAILVSTGQIKGPASAEELENTNNDTDFVRREFGGTEANIPFNDTVVWITSGELVAQMVKAGQLP